MNRVFIAFFLLVCLGCSGHQKVSLPSRNETIPPVPPNQDRNEDSISSEQALLKNTESTKHVKAEQTLEASNGNQSVFLESPGDGKTDEGQHTPATLSKPVAKSFDLDDDGEIDKYVWGDFTIEIVWDEDAEFESRSWFKVFHKGERIYKSPKGHGYGFEPSGYSSVTIAPGDDLTGDGKPNLLIGRSDGGNICWKTVLFYDLGPPIKYIGKIELCEGNVFYEDVDNDGTIEYIWRRGMYFEPHGFYLTLYVDMVYKWVNGELKFSYELMKKEKPSKEELRQQAQELKVTADTAWDDDHCRHDGSDEICESRRYLFNAVLTHMLSGNADSGFKLFKMAWQDPTANKEKTLQQFREQAREHKWFWRKVLKINSEETE